MDFRKHSGTKELIPARRRDKRDLRDKCEYVKKRKKRKRRKREGKGELATGPERNNKMWTQNVAIWWYEGITDNFVYCANSTVVMFFKSPNLLDIYTEIFIDEICCKVIQDVGESEWGYRGRV